MKSRNTIFHSGVFFFWLALLTTGFMSKNTEASPSECPKPVLSSGIGTLFLNLSGDSLPTLGYTLSSVMGDGLILLNGKEVTRETASSLHLTDIEFVAEYQGKKEVQRFGSEKAKNGIIIIRTKNGPKMGLPLITPADQKVELKDDHLVYLLTNQRAQFPGGTRAWTRFITKVCRHNVRDFSMDDFGQCTIRFIVDKEGNVQDVEATKGHQTKMAKSIVQAIAQGPRWRPAQVNGENVSSYFVQPITMRNPLN